MRRGFFASKIGILLASAGSAVGLGNIWRFPTVTGENGGAAFMFVYILCIIVMGLPVMLAEFIIGRHSRSNTATAFKRLSSGTNSWSWIGRLGVLTGILVLSFYNVVAGWTLGYSFSAMFGLFDKSNIDPTAFASYFNSFVSDPFLPLVCLSIFTFMTHFIIVRGVEKGIERFSKLMMPVLFLILIVLVVFSLSMDGAHQGLLFMFAPDLSKINAEVVLSAMGQAFFSLSLGIGCLCTYASYFKNDVNLPQMAIGVAGIDTFVAIISGLIIFPAVFSVPYLEPSEGPQLVFVALPHVFNTAFGAYPFMSYIFPCLFYLLLVLASLTSTISLHEVVTAYISEVHSLSRKRAATLVTFICLFLSVICSLSMGIGSDFKILGMNMFEFFDYITSKWMLPIGGFFISLFVGWIMRKEDVYSELTNNGTLHFRVNCFIMIVFRFIAPLCILFVFLNELGLISWN